MQVDNYTKELAQAILVESISAEKKENKKCL